MACSTCDAATKRETDLRDRVRALFAALDLTDPGWRRETLVDDGDEVNDAWVALAEALERTP
jgi:hypothetical protein